MKLWSTYGFPILNFTLGNNQKHFMQLEKGSFKNLKMVGGLVMLSALANPNQHDTAFENIGIPTIHLIRLNTNCPVKGLIKALIQTKDQCLVIGTIEYVNISYVVLTATPTSCPPILSRFYHHSTCCWFRKLSSILPLEIELTKGVRAVRGNLKWKKEALKCFSKTNSSPWVHCRQESARNNDLISVTPTNEYFSTCI